MSILSDHLLLGGARDQYPCVGAPTWIRGERQLLDTTKKSGCLVSLAFTLKQLIYFVCVLAPNCLLFD